MSEHDPRQHAAGKGDTYRKVDRKQYEAGYDRAFGKKPKLPRAVVGKVRCRSIPKSALTERITDELARYFGPEDNHEHGSDIPDRTAPASQTG